MTKLKPGQSVVRETLAIERGDPLVVELSGRTIQVWPKGARAKPAPVSIEALFDLARKLDARELMATAAATRRAAMAARRAAR